MGPQGTDAKGVLQHSETSMTIKSMLAATLAAATMLTTVGTALAAPGVTLAR